MLKKTTIPEIYDPSKSSPELIHIFWGERQQKFRLALIFNPTIQIFVDLKKLTLNLDYMANFPRVYHSINVLWSFANIPFGRQV